MTGFHYPSGHVDGRAFPLAELTGHEGKEKGGERGREGEGEG